MLPIEACHLATDEEWHELKAVLVGCRYFESPKAREAFDELPEHLKSHRVGESILLFLNSGNRDVLDAAAIDLTQRSLPDAWTLLERL